MSVHDTLTTVAKAIEAVKNDISGEIQKEAIAKNYDRIDTLNQTAKRLTNMETEIQSEHGRIGCCASATPGSKHFSITVSQGALDYHYFVVTPALKAGLMKPNQPIKIKLPTGVEFQTVALMPNRLKERGKIGAFFQQAKVKAGDVLNVKEVSPDVWEVKKA